MDVQTVFKRHELKYLMTQDEKERLQAAMEPFMEPDEYGRTTIRNIYYDTDTYRLVRRSLEKPVYKEKLRIRSYSQAGPDSTVFVELKKKSDSVVYKRRMTLPEREAMAWAAGERRDVRDTQIAREIQYFLDFYGTLRPACFLSYEREAFRSLDGSDLRITFDENILCRTDAMRLTLPVWGSPVTREDLTLMEIKTAGGLPLWLTRLLSEEGIFRTSFSKYGHAYETLILPELPDRSALYLRLLGSDQKRSA